MSQGISRPATSEEVEASVFEETLAEISTAFVRVTAAEIGPEIDRWLERVVLVLGIDRATVGRLNPADRLLYATHQWAREGVVPVPSALSAIDAVPWLTSRLLADQAVVLSRVEDAPPEAARDLEFATSIGTKSTVGIPLKIGGVVVGAMVFDAVTRAKNWSPLVVQRLRLIAEVVGNALERERTVAEIRHLREEMSETSRIATMGELTASLAHELNQPLGAILSNAQAARRFLAAKTPDLAEVRDAVEEIIRDNSRAVQTLRNVRALFQRGNVEMSPLDLHQIMLDAERLLRLEASGRGVSLRLDLPSALPIVFGNRAQLLEVLVNLVTNAVDSICEDDGGPRVVDLRAHSEEGRVQISVRDSGKGIDPQIMPRLFDAFFTTKVHGVGIGLRLARSIVESHGGRLWATRNPDRGATLSFELPSREH